MQLLHCSRRPAIPHSAFQPGLVGIRAGEIVETQGAQQADYSRPHTPGGLHQRVVLGQFRARKGIKSATDPFEVAGIHRNFHLGARKPPILKLLGSQDRGSLKQRLQAI